MVCSMLDPSFLIIKTSLAFDLNLKLQQLHLRVMGDCLRYLLFQTRF